MRRLLTTIGLPTIALLTTVLTLLASCGNGSPSGNANDAGEENLIKLPEDESPHSELVEWWYYTGTLEANGAKPFGFELTFFQALLGVDVPVYMAHFAITDQEKGTFVTAAKTGVEDQRGSAPGFDLQLDGWRIAGHEGTDSITAEMDGYALDLDLVAVKPAVVHYGTGAMTIGSHDPIYYYSYTQMEASGTLTVDGDQMMVTSRAWMDHQWGDIGTDYDGWDWYSLRLDDQTEVMLFVVRWSEGDSFIGGTFIDTNGEVTDLKSDFTITATGQWKSEKTQAVYPIGWTIQIPSLDLDVTVDPVMEDQEVSHSLFGTPIYWEGLCDVTGKRGGSAITGQAYVELTNYDK